MNRTSTPIIAVAVASLVGLAPASLYAQASSTEKPALAEKNPHGDIPDNQVFIDYRSPLGFKIKVPEGWARRETPDGVTFNDKYNTIVLAMSQHADTVTVANVKQQDVPELEKTGRAVRVTAVKSVKLPAGLMLGSGTTLAAD